MVHPTGQQAFSPALRGLTKAEWLFLAAGWQHRVTINHRPMVLGVDPDHGLDPASSEFRLKSLLLLAYCLRNLRPRKGWEPFLKSGWWLVVFAVGGAALLFHLSQSRPDPTVIWSVLILAQVLAIALPIAPAIHDRWHPRAGVLKLAIAELLQNPHWMRPLLPAGWTPRP